MTTALLIAAFGPSLLLIGWALYIYFTQPDPDDYFLESDDDWGRQ